jgi:hypothetical protein
MIAVLGEDITGLWEDIATTRAEMATSREEHQDLMKSLGVMHRDTVTNAARLTDLASDVRKQEAQLKGYRDINNKVTAAIHSNVNNTCAKFLEFCREIQGELEKSSAGLATSIKELETKVELEIQDLKARVIAPSTHGGLGPAASTDIPLKGASVDPPPTPSANAPRFQLPGGVLNPYRGSASFTPGNQLPRDTASPHDRGHNPNKHISTPVRQLRRNPSAGDLREQPTPVTPQEGLTTPAHYNNCDVDAKDTIVGGPIKSPQPSDKERLTRARGVGLFDIAGLATTEYHGGQHSVPELTVPFIHNCGYQSFSNTVSPEDVLICFGEIEQIHRKVLQSWYNPRTLVSDPSVACILDKGFQAIPKLRTLDVQDAVVFYDKFQDLSKDYLLPLMPFDAVQLVNNFEGLFVPGLGTLRYQECASTLFELLPWLIPVTNPEIHAKLCSVRVESKNGYDLFWRILELTVPAFNPTVPL